LRRSIRLVLFAALATVVGGVCAHAADLSKRWQLGGSISFQSTQGSIRSNAAFILFEPLGVDGVPNSGDEEILFADPRRDSLVERETTVDEDFRVDLLVAYGIKPWLSVQLDAAYFKTDMIQLDTFVTERRYIDNGDGLLFWSEECQCITEERESSQSQPFKPAEITQIPVTASVQFRFWPEGVWNLYLNAGVGWVFVDIEETERFEQLNEIVTNERMLRLATQQIPLRLDPRDPPTDPTQLLLEELYVVDSTLGLLPQPDPVKIEAEDSLQFTLGLGGNYFINSRWAVDFEIRYLWINEEVKIDASGYDQLDYTYVSPADLPGCGNGFLFSDDDFPPNFDRFNQGIPGMCRPSAAFPLRDQVLVQGGTIDLSAWVFRLGIRYAF
jgi:opacity protein-like surface antigen